MTANLTSTISYSRRKPTVPTSLVTRAQAAALAQLSKSFTRLSIQQTPDPEGKDPVEEDTSTSSEHSSGETTVRTTKTKMSRPAQAMAIGKAMVEQTSPTKPPILTPGTINIFVVRDWEAACRTYFAHKDVDLDDQVKMTAGGLQDPLIRSWYDTDREAFNALTFEEFLIELHEAWLPVGWELKEKNWMLRLPQGGRPFYDWANEVRNINTALTGTPHFLTAGSMKSQLEARMSLHLQQSIEA